MTAGVYLLRDPINGIVRYVGQSTNIERRYKGHLKAPCNSLVSGWIEELSLLGVEPLLVIAYETEDKVKMGKIELRLIAGNMQCLFNASTIVGFRVDQVDLVKPARQTQKEAKAALVRGAKTIMDLFSHDVARIQLALKHGVY